MFLGYNFSIVRFFTVYIMFLKCIIITTSPIICASGLLFIPSISTALSVHVET